MLKSSQRLPFIGTPLFLVLLVLSCASPQVKPTAELKEVQQVDLFIETIRAAYEAGDFQTFNGAFSPEQQSGQSRVPSLLKLMDSPVLEFTLDQIVLEEEQTVVSLHWELQWLSPSSEKVKQRGNARFILIGDNALQVQSILGDNPFTAPENLIKASS